MADDASQVPGSERREQERVSGRVEVRFPDATHAGRALRAYSLNFSAGGLCLRTKKQYELSEEVELSVDIAGELLQLQAAVAWIRGDAVGFRFTSLSEAQRDKLTAFVDRLKTKGQTKPSADASDGSGDGPTS